MHMIIKLCPSRASVGIKTFSGLYTCIFYLFILLCLAKATSMPITITVHVYAVERGIKSRVILAASVIRVPGPNTALQLSVSFNKKS